MLKDILPDFQKLLTSRGFADDKHAPFYARWVSKFIVFSNEDENADFQEKRRKFLERLSDSAGVAGWQNNQAETALKLYFELFDRNAAKLDTDPASPRVSGKSDPVSIIKALSRAIRVKHYSWRLLRNRLNLSILIQAH